MFEPRGPIVIADDDKGFRRLVASLLEAAGFSTLEAATGEEALDAAAAGRPGLVLLDISLPILSGYEVCRQLRDQYGEDLPIVFVSGVRTEPYDRVGGLLLGADDYLTKPVDPGELVVRVRRLVNRPPRSQNDEVPLNSLTSRERDVLRLLAAGWDQAAIAQELVISPKTVATHIQHVLTKLGVRSRAQAVALVLRLERQGLTG